MVFSSFKPFILSSLAPVSVGRPGDPSTFRSGCPLVSWSFGPLVPSSVAHPCAPLWLTFAEKHHTIGPRRRGFRAEQFDESGCQTAVIVLGKRPARNEDHARMVLLRNGHFAQQRRNRVHIEGYQRQTRLIRLLQDCPIVAVHQTATRIFVDGFDLCRRQQLPDQRTDAGPDVLVEQKLQAVAISFCSSCGRLRCSACRPADSRSSHSCAHSWENSLR